MTRATGYVLDAGALIAVERGDPRVRGLLERAEGRGFATVVPAGVLAQVWRGGRRQTRLARFLRGGARHRAPQVVPLDGPAARAAGELCAQAGTSDVIDASVVLHARELGRVVISSDPDDLRALDPHVVVVPA